MHRNFIVVEDPESRYYEGSLVSPQKAAQLVTRGVTLLPVAPELFALSGVGGYMRRAWGAGWPLDSNVPMMTSKLALYCDKEHTALHWCARLVVSEEQEKRNDGKAMQGILRIASDSSQRNPQGSKLSGVGAPIDISKLGAPDARGGWTIAGEAVMSTPGEGHYGFALYGMAPGLRVLWAAVSCTTTEK